MRIRERIGALVAFPSASWVTVASVKWGAATNSRDIVMIDHRLDGEIRDGRHHLAVRIYYEDTDCAGIVYHASFIRFMERGRTNYLRLLGADQRGLVEAVEREAPGFGFVVRSMTLDFLKPAHMDDILDVMTEPLDVRGASILLRQTVMRGDEVLVDGQIRVAFVSRGRPRPIPKPLRIAMKADQETTTLAPIS